MTGVQTCALPIYEDYIKYGSEAAVREAGKLGVEGKEVSEEMLNLLSNQENTWKIPQGLPDGIKSANKTGETDQDQHDIAIVYGEKTTYILCVMSENCPESTAVTNIQNISKIVYNYLNL